MVLDAVESSRQFGPSELGFDQWLTLFERVIDRIDARGFDRIRGSERRLRRQQATLQKLHRTRSGGLVR
ncbi:MAG TPA: hypothetical protein VKT80_09985, partial [Chloroflexota bacterium]|nr:hypothetical protein [Chloroflexota bacterium]